MCSVTHVRVLACPVGVPVSDMEEEGFINNDINCYLGRTHATLYTCCTCVVNCNGGKCLLNVCFIQFSHSIRAYSGWSQGHNSTKKPKEHLFRELYAVVCLDIYLGSSMLSSVFPFSNLEGVFLSFVPVQLSDDRHIYLHEQEAREGISRRGKSGG